MGFRDPHLDLQSKLLVIFAIVVFLLLMGALTLLDAETTEPVPAPHPETGEMGYWISVEDGETALIAIEYNRILEEENAKLRRELGVYRRREALVIGSGAGIVAGITAFIIFSLAFGGS